MEEKRMYHVKIKNEVKEYEAGITYHDIAKEYQKDYEHEIVLVFVDGKLQELHKRLKKDCEISFVTTADPIGHEAYKRSMSFLLVKAVYDVAGHKNIDKVRMHFAIGPGYYCTITGETRVDDDFLERVESRMHELVEADLSIKKRTVHTDEAIGLFGQYGMYDKEELFRYRRVSKVNLYSINEFEDYYYGYMLYSTGYLKYFKLYRYDEGFVLQMPEIDKPEIVPHFQARTKFFQVMKESVKWGDIQEIETVGGLNRNITSGCSGDCACAGSNAGKKNCRNCTDDCFQTGNQIRIDCGTVVFRKDYIFTQTVCTASCKWNASSSDRSR